VPTKSCCTTPLVKPRAVYRCSAELRAQRESAREAELSSPLESETTYAALPGAHAVEALYYAASKVNCAIVSARAGAQSHPAVWQYNDNVIGLTWTSSTAQYPCSRWL
jgi:hypothetical protein